MTQISIKDNPQIFNVSGKDVFLNLISRPDTGWPIWTCVFLSIAVFAAGCIAIDMRAVVAGLILLLTITPSVCVFMYYYHLLASDIVTNILPHSLERHYNGFLVRLYKPHDDPEGEKEAPATWSECGRLTVFDSSVVKVRRYYGYYLLYLVDAPLRVLYVPADFFLQLNYENS